MMRALYPLVALVLSFPAWGERLELLSNKDDMFLEVRRLIPVGSQVREGKQLLEKNGFRCTWKNGLPTLGYKTSVDYLDCSQQPDYLTVPRRWDVRLVFKGEKVTDLLVDVRLIQ